jgi:lysine-specific demethylase 8
MSGFILQISLVAVEAPDFQLFPLFARAKYAETVLGPGDMLFIPKGTWHHVRSLTTSFSINFWWK